MTEAEFHAPPRDGGWSMGYCIEHLILTGHAFLPAWDAGLLAAQPAEPGSDFPYEWWRRSILHFEADPKWLKRATAHRFVPCSRHSIEETVARFQSMHKELVRRLTGVRGVDARRTSVQSPFSPWLRYELGFSFDLALAHERRHLAQAWKVRSLLLAA